jgi:RNA polymerase sigma factor (sigma-70 family)
MLPLAPRSGGTDVIATPADPMSMQPDAALLAGYGASESEAAAEFVRRFQGRVYGLAVTVVMDRRVAEEVAQEALLRAWRHAADFDAHRGTVASWLLTITRNVAIDTVRRRQPMTFAPDDLAELAPRSPELEPGDVAVLSDDLGRMRAALQELPEAQRRAVVLAGIWGCTSREIATAEAIPLGTAKTRIRLALERLRVALLDGEPP